MPEPDDPARQALRDGNAHLRLSENGERFTGATPQSFTWATIGQSGNSIRLKVKVRAICRKNFPLTPISRPATFKQKGSLFGV
jgi:hypothetical protein